MKRPPRCSRHRGGLPFCTEIIDLLGIVVGSGFRLRRVRRAFVLLDDLFKVDGDVRLSAAAEAGLQFGELRLFLGDLGLGDADLLAELCEEALRVLLPAVIIETADLLIDLLDLIPVVGELHAELCDAAAGLGLVRGLLREILGAVARFSGKVLDVPCRLSERGQDLFLQFIETHTVFLLLKYAPVRFLF
jgi:hypothetical protein